MIRFAFLVLFFLSVYPCALAAAPDGPGELPPAYARVLLDKMRDDIIAVYGTPSRTTKLDNGDRIMEYPGRYLIISKYSARRDKRCTLRVWTKESRSYKVDTLGDLETCEMLIMSGGDKREWVLDLRKPD